MKRVAAYGGVRRLFATSAKRPQRPPSRLVSITEKEEEMAKLARRHRNSRKGAILSCPACGTDVSERKFTAHLGVCATDLVPPRPLFSTKEIHDYATEKELKLREETVQLRFGKANLTHDETAERLGLGKERVQRLLRSASLAQPMVVDDPGDSFEIIFEDKDMLVLNKPPGITHHPRHRWEGGSLLNQAMGHVARNGGDPTVVAPVHRLDHYTSGVSVFAKSRAAASVTGRMLAQKKSGGYSVAKKDYVALAVRGEARDTEDSAFFVNEPLLLAPRLRKGPGSPPPRMHVVPVSEGGKPASTRFSIIGTCSFDGLQLTLFRCRLITGRTHQIRVHLESIGDTLVGDKVYGDGRLSRISSAIIDRQCLHAHRLKMLHPRSLEPIDFVASLPEDFKKACTVVGLSTNSLRD